MHATTPSQDRADETTLTREWAAAIVSRAGSQAEVARRMRSLGKSLDEATVGRWVKGTNVPTIEKARPVGEAFGVPYPMTSNESEDPIYVSPPRTWTIEGMSENDARRLADDEATLRPGQNQGTWRIESRALELAGYLPGDEVLFDLSSPDRRPHDGELVVAQHYGRDGTARTVLRIVEYPYLVTRTMAAAERMKTLRDGDPDVKIMGVAFSMRRAIHPAR